MDNNYLIIALILLAAIGLLFFLIRKNQKDAKKYVQDINRSDIGPEKHKDEKM